MITLLKRWLTPLPVVVGSKWCHQSDRDNPFATWLLEVEEVRAGWVLYRYVKRDGSYRSDGTHSEKLRWFRCWFRPLDRS